MEERTLAQWRFQLRADKRQWTKYYASMLGSTVSDYARFWKALNNYGFWPMFNAILDSSSRSLTGDPLNYVIKVAHSKWQEQEETLDKEEEYESKLEKAREVSRKKNQVLLKKIKKVK